MMCAKFLRSADNEKHGAIYRFSEKFFDTILGLYRRRPETGSSSPASDPADHHRHGGLERLSLHHRPQGLLPAAGYRPHQRSSASAQDISFAAMKEKMTQFVSLVMKDPAVETIVGFAGGNTSPIKAACLSR